MNINEFFNKINPNDLETIKSLRSIIKNNDKSVHEEIDKIMNIEPALVYKEKGYFKYGIVKTKNHFSLYSMVMYTNPSLNKKYKKLLIKAKFNKGCINFKNINDLSIAELENFITESSKYDFTNIMEKYKRR